MNDGMGNSVQKALNRLLPWSSACQESLVEGNVDDDLVAVVEDVVWRQLHKNRSSRKIDSQTIFKRIGLPERPFLLLRISFPGRPIFYTIHP